MIATTSAHASSPEVMLDNNSQVQVLLYQFQNTKDSTEQRKIAVQLNRIEPHTLNDGIAVRDALKKQPFDLYLYEIASSLISKMRNPIYERVLIDILIDEKPYWSRGDVDKLSAVSDAEYLRRDTTIKFTTGVLGILRCHNAVPILKEYLQFRGPDYYASNALAQIGDNTASNMLLEKVYKGDEVNYSGLGSSESIKIVRDLQDPAKKDKWQNISGQIINIKDPAAKPYLKQLLNHEMHYVRADASMKYSKLVNERDEADIIEMLNNADLHVRGEAINAMMRLNCASFDDVLINLLVNDNKLRYKAAKALGYKRVMKSIPYLETALSDKDRYVRREAYISLYILTDKKYEFEGKTYLDEHAAERQKSVLSMHD